MKKIIPKRYSIQYSVCSTITTVISMTEINQNTVWELQRTGRKPFRMEELDETVMHFTSLIVKLLYS